MNRIAKLSAIVALTVLPLAGASQAAGVSENWPQQIDRTVSNYKGNFDVIDINSLNKKHETRTWIDNQSPAEQAAFQKALESNPALSKELKARNIELSNVIGAEQAADGSLTFFTR